MISFAQRKGVRVEKLLGDIGLSPSMLDDYDRRISESDRCRAWVQAAEQSQDPAFGLHVAVHAQVGAYDVLDYALYFSETLHDALERIIRFHRVLCDAWEFKFEVHGGSAHLRRVERTPPCEAESNFALLTLRARQLTGVALVAREIRFAHRAPSDTTPHDELFRCPVRFETATSELVFDAKELTLPIRSANAGVNRILERYMAQSLEHLPKNESFVEHVRAAVSRALHGGPPTLARTARELHASPRTIQRKLRERGTSHTEIVDTVRREIAERLVVEKRMSITEIAFLLRFADLSGFRRMYKRWTGVSPARARSSK